jgi:hypothetical protein
MPVKLAIDPSVQVSPRQFAADWNADPRTDDLATADLQSTGLAGIDPDLGDIVLLVTTQTSMAVSGTALYDLIKDIIVKQGVLQQFQIVQREADDGSELLVVTAEENG